MKTLIRRVIAGLLACAAWVTVASAATEAEKMTAIQNGLSYLATAQQPGGYWNYGGYEQAATGAAVFAFLSQKDKWDVNTAGYQAVVDKAMAYLLAGATKTTVGVRGDGFNPCGTGTCPGVYWYGASETTYTTGLVAPALALYGSADPTAVATTSGPLSGMTWREIAQGITNVFAAGQTTAAHGILRGGWRYYPSQGDSDTSTTQWAVISLIYDQTLGATTPAFVKDELKYWLAAVQGSDGAGCYQPNYLCDHSDTGGLLAGLTFVGFGTSDATVAAALGFLKLHWTEFANSWFGNFNHPYAMWSIYKGLETSIGLGDTTHIGPPLLTDCGASRSALPGNPPGSAACNWWEDYNEWLVMNQATDGRWNGYGNWTGPLSTAFHVSILGATLIPVNQPPVARCQDVTVPANAICKASASIDDGSFDPEGGPVTLSQTPPGPYSLGANPVTLTVTDGQGLTASCSATVIVVDRTAPVVTSTVGITTLWSPSHDMILVGLAIKSLTDNCTASPTIGVKVFGNEDDETPTGDGLFSPDAKALAPGTLKVRAERKGDGAGRVYLIVSKATDAAGNVGASCSTVVVPKSQYSADVAFVNAVAQAAGSYCAAHNGSPPPGYFVVGDGPVIGTKQ
jgi:hypothetical protein